MKIAVTRSNQSQIAVLADLMIQGNANIILIDEPENHAVSISLKDVELATITRELPISVDRSVIPSKYKSSHQRRY